jgi:hypothetical protein
MYLNEFYNYLLFILFIFIITINALDFLSLFQVEVIQRNPEQIQPQDSSVREMQYKLTDKTIQLFAKGTSAAVL